eukprot:Nk52_evm88s1444 gene=Nk52_evmTU88s1444
MQIMSNPTDELHSLIERIRRESQNGWEKREYFPTGKSRVDSRKRGSFGEAPPLVDFLEDKLKAQERRIHELEKDKKMLVNTLECSLSAVSEAERLKEKLNTNERSMRHIQFECLNTVRKFDGYMKTKASDTYRQIQKLEEENAALKSELEVKEHIIESLTRKYSHYNSTNRQESLYSIPLSVNPSTDSPNMSKSQKSRYSLNSNDSAFFSP